MHLVSECCVASCRGVMPSISSTMLAPLAYQDCVGGTIGLYLSISHELQGKEGNTVTYQ